MTKIITTEYRVLPAQTRMRNLGVHVLNTTPEQAYEATNKIAWFGVVLVAIVLAAAFYYQ